MDVLTNPERRRQFDSVDPHYQELEDDAPTSKTFQGLKEKDLEVRFFKEFGPLFEREARFNAKKETAPMLGDVNAPKADVEGFYDFWYNFDSWRSFEYLDKEVNEGSDRFVLCYVAILHATDVSCDTAETTSGTLRRRTSPSVHGGRRRIRSVCATSSTLLSASTLASRGSSRRRRMPERQRRRPAVVLQPRH
jgi:hypothetical protein